MEIEKRSFEIISHELSEMQITLPADQEMITKRVIHTSADFDYIQTLKYSKDAVAIAKRLDVVSQRLVGEKHLALKLRHQGDPVDAIWFSHTEPLPPRVKLAFRLDADEWQGQRRVRFLVEGAEV